MTYVPNNQGLAVAPIVVQTVAETGKSFLKEAIPKLFGGGEKLTYPWRVRPVSGRRGIFEIVYGTQHKWFPVWTGPLETIFAPSGFDVSGATNRGKWRAYVENNVVKVIEFVNERWYPTDSVSLKRLVEVYGYTPRISRVVPDLPAKVDQVIEAGFGAGLGDNKILMVAAAALALFFLVKE